MYPAISPILVLCANFFSQCIFLQMFDAYGNHVSKGLEVQLDVEGFHIQDKIGPKREVRFLLCFWHVVDMLSTVSN
jgi:hypothetical protein